MSTPQAAPSPSERHASWAELYFDVVVVAGVAMLTHGLAELTIRSTALFVLGFAAFWQCWLAFMLYGNSAGDGARRGRLLVGMFGLATMAASVHGMAEWFDEGLEHGHHLPVQAIVFVLAYATARVVASNSWRRGSFVVEWPVAQQVLGVAPWLASIWTPAAWAPWLWALGLALDLIIVLVIDGDRFLAHARERAQGVSERIERERHESRRGPRRGHRRPVAGADDDRPALPVVEAAGLEAGHLGERLGLFVIIVLGEGVLQSVTAASTAEWRWPLLACGLGAFVCLSGMWLLSVLNGYAGVPLLQPGTLDTRVSLMLHGATAAALLAIATGLGRAVGDSSAPLPAGARTLLCGGVATYFLLGAAAFALSGRADGLRLGLWLVTGVGVPVVLGLVLGGVPAHVVVWCTALVVAFHAATGIRRGHRDTEPDTDAETPITPS